MAAKTISGARDLGRAVGRSHTAVLKWLKHPEWTFGRGPWAFRTVEQIKTWAARTLAEDPAAGDGPAVGGDQHRQLKDLPISKQVDVGLKLSRKKRVDFDLDVDKGVYHLVDECSRRRLRQIHEVKTALLNMPDGLPVDADTKTMIKGRVLEILRKWSSPELSTAQPDPHGVPAQPIAG